MASFSFFLSVAYWSLCAWKRCRQAGGTCPLPPRGCSRLAGERRAILEAGSRAGRESLLAAGCRPAAPGEPDAGWGLRRCWGEQGANSLFLRVVKRQTFHKDLEGTAKGLLRFEQREEASGLRARLEKRLCLAGMQWDRGGLIYRSFQFSVF